MDFDDVLTVVDRRYDYLAELVDVPRHKRDLIQELGDSRSTVDRATDELMAAGLLTRTEDGRFRTTVAGDVLRRTVDEARETASTIVTARDLLEHAPNDVSFPPSLFRGSEVLIASGPAPLEMVDKVTSTLTSADRLRALSVADHDPRAFYDLYERGVVEGELEVEVVFTPAMVERAYDAYPDIMAAAEDSSTVSIYSSESVPFGLYVVEQDGESTAIVTLYDENQLIQGGIRNSGADAVAWASETFESYREEAVDAFANR
ncbi:helix-turn-helix transcriptional regulator [Haloarchaeobius sp. TZWWS8]|uniref:helix-turn-helix transcriptional regulator n=1 Tax=Haloarchaeobius sp. TZWWS8 TaxID=3446121 RepID=UPI003EBD95FD